MALRRRSPSPYEVMYNKSTAVSWMAKENGSAPDKPRDQPAPSDQAPESTPAPSHQPWWHRIQQPIVFRLPQGVLALLGVAVVGVVVLAYWVGHFRGTRNEQRPQRLATGIPAAGVISETPVLLEEEPPADPAPPPDVHPEIAGPDESRIVVGRVSFDPRQIEHNYFVLAHYPQAEATRLVEFLARQNQESAAFRPSGKKLYQVVALRGFLKEQLGTPEYEAFKQHLLALGRQWHPQGFTGVYSSRYNGGEVEEILVAQVRRSR